LLARRGYSVGEMEDRLARRGAAPLLRHEIVAKLKSQGYLDDEMFAESFTRSRAARGWGPYKVRAGLLKKKIACSTVEKAVREAYPSGKEEETARQLLEARRGRMWGAKKGGDPGKSAAKALRFLVQRGYSLGGARRAVRGFLGYNSDSLGEDD
jgi:regulatory protein